MSISGESGPHTNSAIQMFGGVGLAFDVPSYIMNVAKTGRGHSEQKLQARTPPSKAAIEVYLMRIRAPRISACGILGAQPITLQSRFLLCEVRAELIDAAISPDWIKQSGVSPSGRSI